MMMLLLGGALSLACSLPAAPAPRKEKLGLPEVKKLLVGKWELPGSPPALRVQFQDGGGATLDVTFSYCVDGKWHHSKTRYKVLNESTLEITIAVLFSSSGDHSITRKCPITVTRDRLRLELRRGNVLILKRSGAP